MMRYIIPAAVGLLYLVQGIYHLYKERLGLRHHVVLLCPG